MAVSLAAQAAALFVPGLSTLLGTVPLGPLDLAVTLGAGVLPYLANEAMKPIRPEAAGAKLPAAADAPIAA